MAVDKQTLDSMLYLWAGYRNSEFKEVSWASLSITGKAMQAAKTGIFSHGTAYQTPDYTLPEYVEKAQEAIIQLPLSLQHVIKEEYTNNIRQKEKAKNLRMSHIHYRAKLCRARQKLMILL